MSRIMYRVLHELVAAHSEEVSMIYFFKAMKKFTAAGP